MRHLHQSQAAISAPANSSKVQATSAQGSWRIQPESRSVEGPDACSSSSGDLRLHGSVAGLGLLTAGHCQKTQKCNPTMDKHPGSAFRSCGSVKPTEGLRRPDRRFGSRPEGLEPILPGFVPEPFHFGSSSLVVESLLQITLLTCSIWF